MLQDLLQGRPLHALANPAAAHLVQPRACEGGGGAAPPLQPAADYFQHVRRNVLEALTSATATADDAALAPCLLAGVAALHVFTQQNLTG